MSANNFQWPSERATTRKPVGVYQVGLTPINIKLDSLAKRMNSVGENLIQASCELCGGSHPSKGCQNGIPFALNDQANLIGSFPRQNTHFSNQYNPQSHHPVSKISKIINHPNFKAKENLNRIR